MGIYLTVNVDIFLVGCVEAYRERCIKSSRQAMAAEED